MKRKIKDSERFLGHKEREREREIVYLISRAVLEPSFSNSSRAFKVDTLLKLVLNLFKKVQVELELEPSFKIIEPSLEPLLSGSVCVHPYTQVRNRLGI